MSDDASMGSEDLVEDAVRAAIAHREVVRAAGGVVYRVNGATTEVVLVHRPAYDDWSLPKGKLKTGEVLEVAALREVLEETGERCLIARSLGTIAYVDRRGREKVVWYWLMRSIGGSFQPLAEVDQVRWMSVADALLTLSYAHDAEVLMRAELA